MTSCRAPGGGRQQRRAHVRCPYSWVWKSNVSDTAKPGLVVDDTARGINASGIFFGPTGRLTLGGARRAVTIEANSSFGPAPLSPESFNPGEAPGVGTITADHLTSGLTLGQDGVTHYESMHNLEIDGDLILHDAYLFTAGTLRVNGSVSGSGAIVATGDIAFNGSVQLRPADSDPGTGISVLSGGELVIGGQPR